MRMRFFVAVTAALLLAISASSSGRLAAQGAAALSGEVSSQEEGKMEGVLVTVRPDGGIYTVTVVSDAKGQYSLPRTHVQPGKYAVSIRAIGYDLASADSVEVSAGKTAKLDITLQKTKDLSRQLTSLDWITIFPGTQAEKDKLAYQPMSCNYCHSYQRILRSKHDEAGLVRAMERMKTYYVDGTASSDDGRGRIEKWTTFGESTGRVTPTPSTQGGIGTPFWAYSTNYPDKGSVPMADFAKYLATVNLGGGRTTWPFELKATLPRPKGPATRVIITQWDMPRKDAVLHDSAVDSKGNLWLGDESGQFITMLNPKANAITDYPLPDVPAEHLKGSRDVSVDADDNPWFPMRVKGGAAVLTKLDPKTRMLTSITEAMSQFTDNGPGNTIWALGGQTVRVDAKTGKVTGTFKGVPGYQKVVSSTGVVCGANNTSVTCHDTKTGTDKVVTLPGGPNAYGRRGKMDAQDRYWFAEYSSDRIAMYDLKADQLKEWPVRKYSTPYCSSAPDRRGYVYAPSNMSERIIRLDPRTGETVEYLMPTELDTKEIQIDPSSGNRTVLLFTNKRNARAVRIEPLD